MDLRIIIGLALLAIAAIPYLKEFLSQKSIAQNVVNAVTKPTTFVTSKEEDEVACFRKLKGLVDCLDPEKDAAEIDYLARKISPKLIKNDKNT